MKVIFLMLLISISGLYAQPSAPTIYNTSNNNIPVFFNNIRACSTPIFNVSATNTGGFNRFQIEINTKSDFTGTAYTQTFSGTYASGTRYDLRCDALTPSLPANSNNTYFVRVRASANGGTTWGAWSSGTWSFTHGNNQYGWYQSVGAQFATGTYIGVTTTAGIFIYNTTNNDTSDYIYMTRGDFNSVLTVNADDGVKEGTTWYPSAAYMTVGYYNGCTYNKPDWNGFRFSNMIIPKNCNLLSSNFRVFTYHGGSEPCDNNTSQMNLRIKAAKVPDATTLTMSQVDTWTMTTAYTDWNVTAPWNDGQPFDNDVKNIIQEIINQAGWNPTQKIALRIEWISSSTANRWRYLSQTDRGANYRPVLSGTFTDFDNVLISPVIDLSHFKCASSFQNVYWRADNTFGSVKVRVYYDNAGTPTIIPDAALPGNSAGFTSGTIDISSLNPATYSKIYLHATLRYNSVNANESPKLFEWGVTANPVPQANAGSDATICSGNSTTLNASGCGAYLWNTGQTTASINVTPASTTTYTLTMETGNCNIATDEVTVNVVSFSSFSINAPATACPNTSSTVSCTQNANYTYNWNVSGGTITSGQGTNQINVTWGSGTSATVAVTVTHNPGNCTYNTSTTVTLGSTINASVSPTNPSVCSGSSVQLTASGGTIYSWAPATFLSATNIANPTCTPTATTAYTITVSDASGCTGTTTVTVNVNPTPTVSITPNTASICIGANQTFNASGANSYSWAANTNINPTSGSSTTANPASTGNFTITVTGTDANGCASTATANLTVLSSPNVSATASPQSTVCQGTSVTLTGSGADTYNWSGGISNGVAFTPSGTTTYTVTGTNTSGCSNTATITITVNPLPTITANASATQLCLGSNLTLYGSGGSSYIWSNGVVNNVPFATTVAGVTTYTVTGTDANNCSNTATIAITVNSLPNISVSPTNPAVCTGQSVTLTASGANTYAWSPATGLSQTTGSVVAATPTTTTTYTITGTSSQGCSATTTAQVIVNPLPNLSATASPQSTVCQGTSVTLTGSGANTYSWSGGVFNGIAFTPSTTTTYTVTGINSTGCSNTATITITVNPLPTITANASATQLCVGSSLTLYGSGGISYIWSNGVVNNVPFTTTTAGVTTYSVTGTDANNCSNTATIAVTVNPLPVVSVNPSNTAICSGQSATLTASGANTYIWSPATGLSQTTGTIVSAAPTSTTIYTVTGTSPQGCSSTTTAQVNVNPLPNVSATASPQSTVCQGSSVTLTGSGANTYSWSGGIVNGVPFTPSATSVYSVTGTDGNGCKNTANITITVNPLPNVTAQSSSPYICSGQSITLTGGGASQYQWSGGVGNAVPFTPTGTGNMTYTVTGTDANSCSNTASVTFNVYPNPQISVSPQSSQICYNSDITLTASGASTYAWAPGATLSSTSGTSVIAHPLTNTTYTVTGTDAHGCVSAPVTVSITVLPQLTATGTDKVICIGESAVLSPTINGGGGAPYTYTWSHNIGNQAPPVSVSPTASTVYTLTINDVCNNPVEVQFNVTVNPLPVATIYPASSVGCAPFTAVFEDRSNQSVTINKWNFGDTQSGLNNTAQNVLITEHTYNVPGQYNVTLTVTSAQNCTSTATATVIVNSTPTADFEFTPATVSVLESYVTFFNKSTDAYSWFWNFGTQPSSQQSNTSSEKNPTYAFTMPGTFNVCLEVKNDKGCRDTTCKEIRVTDDITFYMPNSFVPNSTAENAYFGPKGIGISAVDYQLSIMNKWGEVIFYTNDINMRWDGTYKGSLVPEGVYVWQVVFKDINKKGYTKSGFVNVIRPL